MKTFHTYVSALKDSALGRFSLIAALFVLLAFMPAAAFGQNLTSTTLLSGTAAPASVQTGLTTGVSTVYTVLKGLAIPAVAMSMWELKEKDYTKAGFALAASFGLFLAPQIVNFAANFSSTNAN
jgi:hypothetical protein